MQGSFYELMKTSVLTQAIITILLIAIVGYLLVVGQPVPSEMYAFLGLVLGFYFGGKIGIAQGKAETLIKYMEEK